MPDNFFFVYLIHLVMTMIFLTVGGGGVVKTWQNEVFFNPQGPGPFAKRPRGRGGGGVIILSSL